MLKVKKLIFAILIFFIAINFLLFSAEYILRFIGLGQMPLYQTNLSYRYYLKPNQNLKRLEGKKIIVNDLGLRANKNWIDNNSKKILFYGDSVTYGGGYIDNDEIFSNLVCEKLNRKIKNFTCGNAGVNGYGTDNILNRMIYGDIHDEKFLVLTLIGGSAFRSLVNIGSTPSFTETPKYFPALKEFIYWLLWKTMNKLRKNDWWFEGQIDKNYLVAKKSLKNLNEHLNLLSSKKNIIVILHPNKEQLDKVNDVNKKNLVIKYNLLKEIFLNPENKFYQINLEDYLVKENYDKFYYDDIHLSLEGHNYLSDIIYKEIIKVLEKNTDN